MTNWTRQTIGPDDFSLSHRDRWREETELSLRLSRVWQQDNFIFRIRIREYSSILILILILRINKHDNTEHCYSKILDFRVVVLDFRDDWKISCCYWLALSFMCKRAVAFFFVEEYLAGDLKVCFTVQCCGLWFSFSFAVLLSRRAYSISSICSGVILHSESALW